MNWLPSCESERQHEAHQRKRRRTFSNDYIHGESDLQSAEVSHVEKFGDVGDPPRGAVVDFRWRRSQVQEIVAEPDVIIGLSRFASALGRQN